jgi:nitrogen regulatory protein PII
MIKVVMAYIDQEMFGAIREELASYGIVSFSVVNAGGVSEDEFVAPHFRGSPHTQNLAGKLRLECVVGAEHVEDIKATIFKHETKRSFMFVMNVESASPAELVRSD